MSEWKVIADKIEIFPHPKADKMELGKVGTFQVVVGKGLYKTGDIVVFAPKRSILPEDLRPYFRNDDTGKSYLRGPYEDRVGSISLRGESSEGVILPKEWIIKKHPAWKTTAIPMGVDLSESLAIKEYIPDSHVQVEGKKRLGKDVERLDKAVDHHYYKKHDVEQFGVYKSEFLPDEPVIVTEKVHGTQINVFKDRDGIIVVSSKGRAEKGLVLLQYPKKNLWYGKTLLKKIKNLFKVLFDFSPMKRNDYWQYLVDSNIPLFLARPDFAGKEVQVFGEVVPVQKGFSYGYTNPHILVFRVIVEGEEQHYGYGFFTLDWVPLLYRGILDENAIRQVAEGTEKVSGKNLHIKEGVVVQPENFRRAKDGVPLFVKVLNSKYKESDDDIS
jgi:hypothetical protein